MNDRGDTVQEVLIDARGLEPPEPMEQVLAALYKLNRGERLRFLIHREPFPLYALLQDEGWHFLTKCLDDGSYELIIEHGPEA